MGLLNMGLMPGEWDGQGMGGLFGQPNKMQGMLSNPMLQMGLGILANNNSKNLSQVLGKGALTGLGNVQQQQQWQAQLAQQKQQNEFNAVKKKQMEYEIQQQERKQKAIEAAIAKNPDMADLYNIDPEAAIKAMYPKANGIDPYFTPVATEQGLGSYNNRTGGFELVKLPNGQSVVKSIDSPQLQGQIAQEKARGTGNFKVNDSLKDFGIVGTETDIANMTRGKQLPQIGNPQSMQIPPQVQAGRDDKRMQILLAEQQQYGGAGANPELDQEIANVSKQMGIRVPTKAQLAGQVKTAEKTAESVVNMQTEKKQAVKKSDQLLSAAREAQALLDKDPTGSLVGAGLDTLGRGVGISTDSAQTAAQLETLSGWMVANVPRMEGPQSNFDVQNYQTMAGKVGDRTVPVSERKAALNKLIQLQEKYKALNQTPTDGTPTTPKAGSVRKYNPKTGKIE